MSYFTKLKKGLCFGFALPFVLSSVAGCSNKISNTNDKMEQDNPQEDEEVELSFEDNSDDNGINEQGEEKEDQQKENEVTAPHPNYRLAFEDNFDGDFINLDEWIFRTGERLGGINQIENVTVRDGRLAVRFDREEINGEMKYTGGGIISNRLFGYGYYEAKGKLWGECGGLHSSFWSMGRNGDGETSPKQNVIIEIDGYEVDSGKPKSIGMNVHYYIGTHKTVGGIIGTRDYTPIDTSEEDFILGYEWLPNQINWYLNGELIRQIKNPLYYGPQNVWITALATEVFDGKINNDKLPGESSWDYFKYYIIDLPGVNMIVNPGFEYNYNKDYDEEYKRSLDTPIGWYKEGRNLYASSVHPTSEAFEGECVLRHYSEQDYEVTTKVIVPFLSEGTYELKAMVRNPQGGNHKMCAYVSNGEEYSIDMPKTEKGKWVEIKLENIKVPFAGECTVAFVSNGKAGETLEVDEVSLALISEEPPHTPLERFEEEEEKPWLPLGAILVHPTLKNSGYQEFGEWRSSGLSGHLKGSRYAKCNSQNYAIWNPLIKDPGIYEVSFYNVCYENRSKTAKVEIFNKNGVEEKIITQQGTSGWINLGNYELDDESYVKLSAVEGEMTGLLSAESVLFEPLGTKQLRAYVEKTNLFMADTNIALIEGVYKKYDKTNPLLRPYVEEGVLMVPLIPVATVFGAGTFNYSDDGKGVDIFFKDYMVRFKQDSDLMNVRTKDIQMKAPCRVEDGDFYVPFVDLAYAFDKKIWSITDRLVCVSDSEVDQELKLNSSVINLLEELFKDYEN